MNLRVEVGKHPQVILAMYFFILDKSNLYGNHYNTEDVMLGYTCYAKHTMKMSLLAKRTDLYYQKEPPETCIRYLSKYHPAAATIESIPSSEYLFVCKDPIQLRRIPLLVLLVP
jgi:hypothetical protein